MPWEVKECILKEIYDNDYYDYYGVGDPMKDLAEAICLNREENLKRAEIMMGADCGYGYLGAEAAFKKLMQRAHRRNAVRSAELDAEFN